MLFPTLMWKRFLFTTHNFFQAKSRREKQCWCQRGIISLEKQLHFLSSVLQPCTKTQTRKKIRPNFRQNPTVCSIWPDLVVSYLMVTFWRWATEGLDTAYTAEYTGSRWAKGCRGCRIYTRGEDPWRTRISLLATGCFLNQSSDWPF